MPDPVPAAATPTPAPPATETKPAETKPATALIEAAPEKPKTEEKPSEAAAVELQPFTLPDGQVADPVLMGEFTTLAKELKLDQATGQRLVDLYTKAQAAQYEQLEATVKKWAEDTQKDKEIGGQNFDATKAAAARVMAKYATPELREFLSQTRVGDHPELIRFVARIGKEMREDTSGPAAAPAAEKTPAEMFYGKVDTPAPANP